MNTRASEHIDLNRKFWPVEIDKENDPERIRAQYSFGLGKQLSWEDLLLKNRVVILAEPGTGKTEEFRAVSKHLKVEKKHAFFCRLDLLQKLELRQSLDIGTVQELDEWFNINEEGYFFLDSVDEASIKSHTAFEIALRSFSNTIGEKLNRAKIFISCRVSNWRATGDLSLFLTTLPYNENNSVISPSKPENYLPQKSEQAYKATIHTASKNATEEIEDHPVFQLAPLDDQQISSFITHKGVDNPKNFIEAIDRADSRIFAERPQDLLELIAYWKSNGRLGKHAEMLEFNINIKLAENDPDRDALKPLSQKDALSGAECLAAAITLQKKSTIILPDSPVDNDLRAVSIEPRDTLRDWSSEKIQTLLDRAIFDEAIYGTVRFHHRIVQEFLAARWLNRLIMEGKSRRAIEKLIFSKRYGRNVIIPSMRSIAAWLGLWDDKIKNQIKTIAPEVLIENGDPSVLPIEFRKSLLIWFAELYTTRQYTGSSFDITMVRRLADPLLASTINDLLKRYASHHDICSLLLRLIWQGQITESVDAALPYAMNELTNPYIRTCAIRAVAAAGTDEQKAKLVNLLIPKISKLNSDLISEICELFFPEFLSIPQLLKVLETASPPEQYSFSQLQQTMEKIANIAIPEEELKQLLRGLYSLIMTQPFIDKSYCKISEKYAWLLPSAIRISNQFIQKRHDFSFDNSVLDLFLGFLAARNFGKFDVSDSNKITEEAKAWPEFCYKIFWHAIAASREKETGTYPTEWWQVRWDIRDFWAPGHDYLGSLFNDMSHKIKMDERLIALTAIFSVYANEGRPRQLLIQIKKLISGTIELETKLHELLHPLPLSEDQKKHHRLNLDFKKKQKKRENQQETNRQEWQQSLRKNPSEIKNVGNAQKGEIWKRTAYLYDRIREKKDKGEHWLGYSKWKLLIDEFGFDVARNFRDGCIAYWREYDPFTFPNRRTSNVIPWPRMIGLSGIAMEAADDPKWINKINYNEAILAAHYSVCELSGFPNWFSNLNSKFPELVEAVIKDEVQWEIHNSTKEKPFTHTISALRYGNKEINNNFKTTLFDLLSEQEPLNDIVLDYILTLLLESPINIAFNKKIAELACKYFLETSSNNRKFTWLIVLFCIDGLKGCELLNRWINPLPFKNQKETVINFCGALSNHGEPRFNITVRDYEKIEVLQLLLPTIYKFVKLEEDIKREGIYTPSLRDHAEETRSRLLNVVLNTSGRLSYDLLMSLSEVTDNSYLKDRMDYLAKERAALDSEFEQWHGTAVAEFTLSAEKQPRSEADLYDLALIRLDDLKMDIEEGDESEAEYLKTIKKETGIRISFANRLKKSSRSLYTVGSEEELADATRTDIRINAPKVSSPVPIEIKIADKWTLSELRERMENQLIGQYMRTSHHGIFLMVHNGIKRNWRNSQTKKVLSFEKLVEVLKQDSIDLMKKYANIAALEVIGVDFTVR